MTGPVPLGILDRQVASSSHVCAFYTGSAGRDEIVLPFLAEGLRSGHKCIAVLDSVSPADVLARLDRSGVDAEAAAQTGQLELDDPARAYFRAGTSYAQDMVGYWEDAIDAVRTCGTFGLVKATALGSPLSPGQTLPGRVMWRRAARRMLRKRSGMRAGG